MTDALGGRLAPEVRWAEANRLISYHSPIARSYTAERTSYSSQLIPVTAYILVACCETYYRYPDLMAKIDAAMPAEEIARAGHRPGSNINSVYLWSIANFYLTGRKIIGAIDPSTDDPDAAFVVLDFWERAAMAFRHGDGTRQVVDAGGVVRAYPASVIAMLVEAVVPIESDEKRAHLKRFNATLVNYLFLLYFDTRVGTGDSGPYQLPDGRLLIVRDFYRMAQSDFWWSDVAAEVPYQYLTAAMVLDGVDVKITDFGTSNTVPEDYLDHLVGFALFTSDTPDRSLRPVSLAEIDDLIAVVRKVNAQHYRNVAAMGRDEMIRCGAYVYFTFLRPFAEVAGVADELDWTVPRDLPEPVYQLLSALNGDDVPFDAEAEYYLPLAPLPAGTSVSTSASVGQAAPGDAPR